MCHGPFLQRCLYRLDFKSGTCVWMEYGGIGMGFSAFLGLSSNLSRMDVYHFFGHLNVWLPKMVARCFLGKDRWNHRIQNPHTLSQRQHLQRCGLDQIQGPRFEVWSWKYWLQCKWFYIYCTTVQTSNTSGCESNVRIYCTLYTIPVYIRTRTRLHRLRLEANVSCNL